MAKKAEHKMKKEHKKEHEHMMKHEKHEAPKKMAMKKHCPRGK